MGLQTVTWLLDGELLHLDSLGSEQLIRPGQLNLMTTVDTGSPTPRRIRARATAHGCMRYSSGWPNPEATRHDPPASNITSGCPGRSWDGGTATVMVGEFAGATSPPA